jgi:hypothetical protein
MRASEFTSVRVINDDPANLVEQGLIGKLAQAISTSGKKLTPANSPQAKQAASWEKFKQSVPGMTSSAKSLPKDAREAAMQHWMSQYGRPPMQSYGANTTGSLNNEMGRFYKLVDDYMNTDPRYWSNMQSFKIK